MQASGHTLTSTVSTFRPVEHFEPYCRDNGKGRCSVHDNGRYTLDHDGQCLKGRRHLKASFECPLCFDRHPNMSGLMLNRRVLARLDDFNAEQISTLMGDKNLVCPDCAGEYNTDHRDLFVRPGFEDKAVVEFVKAFLSGRHVQHIRKFNPELNVEVNKCDFSGRWLEPESENDTLGVSRKGREGNTDPVICLAPEYRQAVLKAVPDLPAVSFVDALERAIGRPIKRYIRPESEVKVADKSEVLGREYVDGNTRSRDRGDGYQRSLVQMEFMDTMSRRSSGGKRRPSQTETAGDKIRANAKKAFEARVVELKSAIAKAEVRAEEFTQLINALESDIRLAEAKGEDTALIIEELDGLKPEYHQAKDTLRQLQTELARVEKGGAKLFRINSRRTPEPKRSESDQGNNGGKKNSGGGKKK